MMQSCRRCEQPYQPKRVAQVYCSRRCRVADAVSRHRRSDYIKPHHSPVAEKRLQATSGPPTAPEPPSYGWGKAGDPIVSGDDYELEYYEDGFPKLPDCLRRIQRGEAE